VIALYQDSASFKGIDCGLQIGIYIFFWNVKNMHFQFETACPMVLNLFLVAIIIIVCCKKKFQW
jgi:hypothetical protein